MQPLQYQGMKYRKIAGFRPYIQDHIGLEQKTSSDNYTSVVKNTVLVDQKVRFIQVRLLNQLPTDPSIIPINTRILYGLSRTMKSTTTLTITKQADMLCLPLLPIGREMVT